MTKQLRQANRPPPAEVADVAAGETGDTAALMHQEERNWKILNFKTFGILKNLKSGVLFRVKTFQNGTSFRYYLWARQCALG